MRMFCIGATQSAAINIYISIYLYLSIWMKCALISRRGFLTYQISPSYLPKVAINSENGKCLLLKDYFYCCYFKCVCKFEKKI